MDKQIAFTSLTVKAVDKSKRLIRGMATCPTPDRVDDIVDPLGVTFSNPAPLLWMHRHYEPVGTVNFGKPTKEGVPFEASFPIVEEPSQLRSRIEEAYQSCVAGLVRHVSIGFRPLEYSIIEQTGGYKYTKTDVFELSLVTVPACPDASFEVVKAFDRGVRAASGKDDSEVAIKPASVLAKTKTVNINQQKEDKMSLAEKLKGFKEAREQKRAKIAELAEKSVDSGETFDVAQQEEFDSLVAEEKALADQIARTETAISMSVAKATPVAATAVTTEKAAADVRGGHVTVKAVAEQIPGLGFARLARAKAISKESNVSAYEVAKQMWPDDLRVAKFLEESSFMQKAAVAAGTTTNATWAAPLVRQNNIIADFVEFLRPSTILGKFGAGGIPSLRSIPFRTALLNQTSGGDAYWVGEGNAKPLTKFDFSQTSLDPLKVASIAVITKELLWDSNPAAEVLVRDSLRDALAARLDQDFIDPSVTLSAGIRPASITNGITPIPSSGDDAAAVRCDIQALMAAYLAANNPPTTGVIIMSATRALALSLMLNPLGQPEFAGITMNGGTLLGLPVIVSNYVPSDTDGDYVFMINATDIYYADGEVMLDMSDQASLQMDNAPDNPTGAGTVMVSMWQRNMVAFLVEKRINYKRRRDSAVAVLSGVNWTTC